MKNKPFQQILQDIRLLSPQQFGILQPIISWHLQKQGRYLNLEHYVEHRFSSHPSCPYCKALTLQRYGIRAGRQCYRCKQCHRIFNAFTKTPLSRLRHNHSGRWSRYLKEMTRSTTLRKAAKICEITLKTAFLWRHKIWQIINDDPAKKFGGIIELDETFFRESFKGRRDGLPRTPGRRGSDKVKARKIPVMVTRDRQVNTVDRVLKNEGARGMVDGLKGRISIAAVVCADASLAHQSLARKLGFPLKELTTSAGQHVLEGVFHIQHVNAYHSH
ncbi:hypothetical protein CI610_00470 [invertebrate metagenome]|uniref:ISXO2-like transposase domain-containing protein n=1 Tax=invertebrate metagenome TaxID=1711999 RepID=A0A2H9TBS9_9ZZZZ